MKKLNLFLGIIALMFLFSASGVLAHEVMLRLEDSDGAGIENGKARYGSGSSYMTAWWSGGLTQVDGNTNSVDLPTGTYSFEMLYNGTSARKISVYIDSDVTLTWVTTTVTLQYSGRIRYGGPSGVMSWFKSSTITSTETKELLPGGTYTFRADPDGVFDLTITDPPSMTKSLVHLKLTDHNGDPLAGGKARGGYGSSYSTWWATVNPTNAEGIAVDIRDGLKTNLSYQMLYNYGGQIVGPQDVSVNSFFEFQTELVTLQLEKCDGTPLDGGKPRFGSGASYVTSFWPNGNTGWSAPGETTAELFQGTYSFDMGYNGTSDQKVSQVVPDGGATFTWKTTEVTLQYGGAISFGGSGSSRWFNKPTMDLLPGTYNFKFDGYLTSLNITGCSVEKDIFVLKVIDSNNDPIQGVNISWNHRYSSYTNLGTTGAGGVLFVDAGVPAGPQKFKAVKDYTAKTLNTDGMAVFQTSEFNVLVKNSAGDPLENIPVKFNHRYSSYMSIGTTDVNGVATIELFPGSRKFKATKDYTSQVGILDISASGMQDQIGFQTAKATALVKDCSNDQPIEGAVIQFNHRYSSYMNVGTTGPDGKASIELFPGDRKFKASINYTNDVKTFALSNTTPPDDDVDVEFNPTRVNIHYAGDVRWNYRYSSYTSVFPNYYMFPGTYDFKFMGANDNALTALTINDCEFEKSYVNLSVDNSDGSGQDGVSFVYQIHGSPPDANVPGTTGLNGAGVLLHELDGKVTNKVRYIPTFEDVDGVRRDPTPTTASFAHWDMQSVRVELMSACDGLISATPNVEVTYEQPGNGRHTLGYIGTAGYFDKDILPFGGFVALFIDDYKNSSDRINYYSTNSIVTFQTTKCVDGSYGTTQYTEGGPWYTWIGSEMELLNSNGSWTAFKNSGGYYKAYLVPGKVYDINAKTFSDCPAAAKSAVIGATDYLNEITPEFSYKLYPVPARNELNVNITFEAKERVHYQVIDITGRVMKEDIWMLNRGLNTMKVEVNDMVDGQYIFLLKSDGRVIKDKFSVFKY